MGIIMIRCPVTGRSISTGMECLDRENFSRAPVFFARTPCPHCRTVHEWFAGDAWVQRTVSIDDVRDGGAAANAPGNQLWWSNLLGSNRAALRTSRTLRQSAVAASLRVTVSRRGVPPMCG